jgi:hypothetical protein
VHAQTKPQVIGPIHDEGIDELFACTAFGFTVLDDFTLDFTLRWFTDKDGNRVKGVEQVSGIDTFINSETGKAIAAPYHNNVLIDPEVGLGASAGIIFKVTVPGAGAVFLDVGRIVTNQAGDIITFEAGPHQFFDGDVDALCAALA